MNFIIPEKEGKRERERERKRRVDETEELGNVELLEFIRGFLLLYHHRECDFFSLSNKYRLVDFTLFDFFLLLN